MARWGEGQEGANKAGRKGAFGGRMRALQCLDKMLARRKTQATLIRALDEEFTENPIGFFRTIIMPLLPKEAKLTVDHDGVLEWKSMLGPVGPVSPADTPPVGERIDVQPVEVGRLECGQGEA